MEYVYSTDLQSEYYEKGYGISLIPAVLSSDKKPSIPGIEGFLPKKYDAIFPANPSVITESSLEGMKWAEAFSAYVFTGGDLDGVIKDLNTRYNAALEKSKAAGLTKIAADPSFDSSKLQGKLSKEE